MNNNDDFKSVPDDDSDFKTDEETKEEVQEIN